MGKRLIIISYQIPDEVASQNSLAQIPENFISSFIKESLHSTEGQQFADILWIGGSEAETKRWSPAFNDFRKIGFSFVPIHIPGMETHYQSNKSVPYFPLTSVDQPDQGQEFSENQYKWYLKINRLFANTVRKYARQTDVIWIYDYQLLLLPALIRAEMPYCQIGLLLPNTIQAIKIANVLPEASLKELLNSMLGADLIGFTDYAAVTMFLKQILKLLGYSNDGTIIYFVNRLIMVRYFQDDQQKANSFITELKQVKKMQQTFQVKFLDEYSRIALFEAYRSSKKRLILLDYDGTLVSFYPEPELAVPGAHLRELLGDLCAKKENDVFVVSGRSSAWLQLQLGDLPLNLVAEHGARYKWKGDKWQTEIAHHNDWKAGARAIMGEYVTRCAESLIEEKEFSFVWHYRKSATEEGKSNAKELCSELNEFVVDKNLQVLPGNKIVEIRQLGINKGLFLKKIIDRVDYDFTIAIGDDKTDEDMFQALMGRSSTFTVKVGPEASYAQFNLHTPSMVISLLEALNHLG